MSWKITLGSGRELSGLELSGTTFLSIADLTKADFAGELRNVIVECSDAAEAESAAVSVGEHEQMTLTILQKIGRKTGFTLMDVEKPEPESVSALRADVDYLLMLSEEA